MCVYMLACVPVCVCVHTCACACVHTCMHVHVSCVYRACVRVCVCVCMCVRIKLSVLCRSSIKAPFTILFIAMQKNDKFVWKLQKLRGGAESSKWPLRSKAKDN